MKQSRCTINTSFDHSAPVDFLQSQWQSRDKSPAYLIYRWTIALFYIFSVVYSLVTSIQRKELQFYYIYLTHWNLIFNMGSMVLSAVLVTLYHLNRLKLPDRMTRELKTYWFLSTTSNMYAFLVSLIYWTVLYKQDMNVVDANNILVHATNSLVLLVDLAVVKHPGRLGIFVYSLGCGCMYLFFSWLYPFLGGLDRRGHNYIYPILNWKEKPETAILAASGVTVGGAIVHCLLVCFHRLRTRLHVKFFSTKKEKGDTFLLTC